MNVDGWWQIVFFVTLILALSALRSRLFYEFVGVSLLLFHTRRIGIWIYSLVFLPGTILHELSHWITAEILGVRTGEITILPDLEDNQKERLGSVQTENVGPFRGFIIGAAPFFTGLIVLALLGYFLFLGGWTFWQYALLIYGIIVVGSSMLLSAEDRRSWPAIIIFTILVLVSVQVLNLSIVSTKTSFFLKPLTQINKILIITTLAILVFISISYIIRRIIEKLTGQLVVRR